ncbi:uncharacterized protein LOC120157216 [Hibiscus syriacus]|uniref:uncharacterized protein LOC120157216 n=1 Tax=Hibiscus syriacus TaxID=106335 RepID=UPI001920DBE1|nr:uncharacterized protein LOC120157216 [Hibiscus syriacus]
MLTWQEHHKSKMIPLPPFPFIGAEKIEGGWLRGFVEAIVSEGGEVKAASSVKETAAAITTYMLIPQAADGVTPSLKNFLLSITAAGLVLAAIVGALIGVSNFDPVKQTSTISLKY